MEQGEPLALNWSLFSLVRETSKPKTDGSFGKSALEVALTVTSRFNQTGHLEQGDFSSNTGPCDLFVITGEASGDEHAAQLIKDLLHLHPQLNISALGGEQVKMRCGFFPCRTRSGGVVGSDQELSLFP